MQDSFFKEKIPAASLFCFIVSNSESVVMFLEIIDFLASLAIPGCSFSGIVILSLHGTADNLFKHDMAMKIGRLIIAEMLLLPVHD